MTYHPPMPEKPRTSPTVPETPVSVLVVDDTTPIRHLLKRILEEDYEVHTAPDGEAALEVFARLQPEIVLLDVNMPRLSGLDVVRELRASGAEEAVVIMLTGEDDTALKADALNLGANDFLTKPFNKGELLARVAAAARQVALMREIRQANARTAEDLRRIAALQRRMLPDGLTLLPGLAGEIFYRPSSQASGDYYDCARLPDGSVRIAVADVSGHGAKAAFFMAVVRTLFHAAAEDGLPLDAFALRVNRHLHELSAEGEFATLFAADIEPGAAAMTYVSCGHPPALLTDGGTQPTLLKATMPLLGVMDCAAELGRVGLPEHFGLLLYTDGFYEWRAPDGGMFGLDRFLSLATEQLSLAGPFLPLFYERLCGLAGTDPAEHDDLTALWLTRGPHA
ncbi:response regulator receiver modulated serine phosphatase [Desulfovibrio sp. X2]|uniref:SpoIIE family protein phosphatase n=1 Tax=Desulfovibrio sp. X2 TaxID=941449 RepID=UPI000358E761|nr:SpoIIE family protein phosphatase [Desulfovibrio sp. X2]EPR43892.1 response regulator receiver modulated serine phosphatase [Desulfovibrio sp. X2]